MTVNNDSNHERLESLLRRAVDHELGYAPVRAYSAGLPAPDHRRWPDRAPAALRAYERGNDELLAQLNSIESAGLPAQSLAAYDTLREQLESERQMRVCRSELWDVSHFGGWHLSMVQVAQDQPVGTPEERAQALERWNAAPAMIEQEIANLRLGLKEGYSAAKGVVRRVVKQAAGLAEAATGRSPLLSPAERSGEDAFKVAYARIIEERVNPALRAYRDYLQNDYLPHAREDVAMTAMPKGEESYQALLRMNTTLNRTAQQVHDLGQRTVERNVALVIELGAAKFGTRDLPTILRRVEEAADNTFASEGELISYSREAVMRAREKCIPLFARLPEQEILVEPFREFMRGSGSSSHYELQPDLSKPAYYRIATDAGSCDSTRGSAELTAIHEAYPGHHLQISLAYTLKQSPVAKLSFNGAYLEGWARYAEMMAEEEGLYRTDYVRISRRIWPARGLVADTGLHMLGWTPEQTMKYLMDSGRFTATHAQDMIDRMACMPGQLTSYDSGGLEFMALREQAKQELGPRFDLREFHSTVLDYGVVPLAALRRNVERWIDQRR